MQPETLFSNQTYDSVVHSLIQHAVQLVPSSHTFLRTSSV